MSTDRPDPVLGLEAALELEDWERCLRIIEDEWLSLAFGGDLPLLSRAILNLPAALCESSPTVGHLSELFGVLPLGTVPVQVPVNPDAVAELARSTRVRAFVGRTTLAFIGRRLRGQTRAAHAIALAASRVVDQTPLGNVDAAHGPVPQNSVADLKTFFYLHCGLTAHQADDPVMALRMFNQAWREREYDTTGFATRGTAIRLAIEAAVAGSPDAARRWLDRAADQPRESEFAEQFASRGVALAEFLIALDTSDAATIAHTSTAVTEGSERDEQWPFVTWARVRHALLRQEPEQALALLDALQTHYPQTAESDGLYAALLHVLRAETELALGRGNRARAALLEARPTAYFGQVTEARIALLSGNDDDAAKIAATTAARPDLNRRARLEALLIQAVAELRRGQSTAACTCVQRVVGMMADDAPQAAILAVPRSAIRGLAAALPDAAPLAELRDALAVPDLYPKAVDLIQLTERENVVLHRLAEGMNRQQLAHNLFVSENTVKSQVRTLYAKLGVTSRTDAVARAHDLGLLGEPG